VLSANPRLTSSQLASILTSTATDLGSPNYDTTFGNGLVNADAAVRKALATP
jgi:serine protease